MKLLYYVFFLLSSVCNLCYALPPNSLSPSHRQHVMTLLIHDIILLRHIEFPKEVKGNDSVAVDDDGEQHACQDQLWEEEEVLEMAVSGVVLCHNHFYFTSW